jgi:hypothetical protein
MPSTSVPMLPSAKSDACTVCFWRLKPKVLSRISVGLSVQVWPTVG